jgi:hypothetical protein
MLREKPGTVQNGSPMIAYVTKSQDREGNLLYLAAICDSEKDELIKEFSGYDRIELEKDVLRHYPGIEIEVG